MAILHKYKLYCDTESAYVFTSGYQEDPPTVCPNNNGHTIDSDTIVAVDTKAEIGPVDISGKPRVQQTSKKLGLLTIFQGAADDPTDVNDVGGGLDFVHKHSSGDGDDTSVIFDLNIASNETWLHEGCITAKDAKLDRVSFSIVTRVTTTSASTNTNYNLMGGYLIIPAAGDGTIDVPAIVGGEMAHDAGLVFIPVSSDTGVQAPAFWKADWDSTNGKFINITAAPLGDGNYNMFAVEIELSKFINKIPVMDYGVHLLKSSDSQQLGHGMRCKIGIHTNRETEHDHNWSIAWYMTLHRARTS